MLHAFVLALFVSGAAAADLRKALIVDGQNNHQWQLTTPLLKKILTDSGLFQVDVATTPPQGADMSVFRPNFAAYDIVVSNYNGDAWSAETRKSFTDFVRKGGGLVIVHAADNAFPEWKEFNEMIALGGWGNRNEKAGPYVRFRDGKFQRDNSPGKGGSHGAQHEFRVDIRNIEHPITKGLPPSFMHAKDELYDRLRGPAENLTVLATAYSEVSTRGTGEHEPILMTIKFGGGRVFHTTLGHSPEAMSCVGFIVTLQRGAEWAATGKVKQKLPQDYPMGQVSTRKVN
jgi:type 1 glutamine amidotransferase